MAGKLLGPSEEEQGFSNIDGHRSLGDCVKIQILTKQVSGGPETLNFSQDPRCCLGGW